jgi:hypothetical protein
VDRLIDVMVTLQRQLEVTQRQLEAARRTRPANPVACEALSVRTGRDIHCGRPLASGPVTHNLGLGIVHRLRPVREKSGT